MARKKSSSSRKSNSSKRRSSRSRSSSRSNKPRFTLSTAQKVLLSGVFVIFLTAVLILSLISPDQGELTTALSNVVWQVFGWGSLVAPLIGGGIGLYLVLWGMGQPPKLPGYRLLGLALLFLVVLAFASMIVLTRNDQFASYGDVARAQTGGGYMGGAVADVLTGLVGHLGAIFTLGVLGLLGAIFVLNLSREDLGNLLQRGYAGLQEQMARPPEADIPQVPELPAPRQRRLRFNRSRKKQNSDTAVQLPIVAQEPVREITTPPIRTARPTAAQEKPARRKGRGKTDTDSPNETPTIVSPVFVGGKKRPSPAWQLPGVTEILDAGSEQGVNNAAIREQVEIIEHTLESFGAPATVVEINQGPTITQFGVEPNYLESRSGRRTKVKVGKIASLADDLALALAARSIRIQAPVPGKPYVGIEVPNVSKVLVSLRDVMESSEFRKINSPLRIGLGQNVAGQSIATDLAAMPHLLIAGTTGSGKSVCVNGIIACLLLQNTPEDLKVVMVDPKRVELTGYNGVPHLAAPVVVDMDRVISTLQWALREMDIRYKMFAQVGARNIRDYNKKTARQADVDKMPYIAIIIDELADLMMLAPEDTERAITRLAQMARATGIHMIIATQRPSVDVVTGLIKANFPARIAFAVASSTDSRVILDSTGAERLLGQGDMLFQSPDAAAPVRLQGCFVSDGELTKLIGYWQQARRFNLITEREAQQRPQPEQRRPAAPPQRAEKPAEPLPSETKTVVEPAPARTNAAATRPSAAATTPSKETKQEVNGVPQQKPLWKALEEAEETAEQSELEETDELMPEAIALVRKLNKASTSLLQRRFRIGYTRAARMIDAMEQMNIIGPPTGTSKAREVLPADGAEPADESPDSETTEEKAEDAA